MPKGDCNMYDWFHHLTLDGQAVWRLREGPRLAHNLYRDDEGPAGTSIPQGLKDKAGKICGHGQCVYYLWGDERAAVRLFMRENWTWVVDQLEGDGDNEIRRLWGEGLYNLLLEEYELESFDRRENP